MYLCSQSQLESQPKKHEHFLFLRHDETVGLVRASIASPLGRGLWRSTQLCNRHTLEKAIQFVEAITRPRKLKGKPIEHPPETETGL